MSSRPGIPAPQPLPDATHVGAVRLQVADLSRSLDYYTGVLGLRLLEDRGDRAVLGPHGDARPLVELHALAGARPVPPRGRLGLFHFAMLVPDRAALGRFVAHLADLGVPAASADHAVSEALYLTDPDGLGIEVYADRPRAMWRAAGAELYMTTERLDLRGLIRAAGDTPWTGLPPGTVMGHVHLHVGDLEAGAAFYHRALGLDKVAWSYPGALFLSAGGYHHHLGTNVWAGEVPSAQPDEARLLEWELVVPDVVSLDATVRRLREAGMEVTEERASRLAADPWGTAVRLRIP